MDTKKWGLTDGMLVGSGFFLGYFVTKWLVALILIVLALWGILHVAIKYENGGYRTTQVSSPTTSSVRFQKKCDIRSGRSRKTDHLGTTTLTHNYNLLEYKNDWIKVFDPITEKAGWTRCQFEIR